MSGFKNINVVYYYIKNWEQAKKFYTETVGWPQVFGSDEIGWIEFGKEGEIHLAISRWTDDSPVPTGLGGATVVLSVDNARETTAILRAKGVRCDDVFEISGMVTYGTFYDPEGNRIQFASM
jgi:predicted enzyme related to lactoylglutathione lyase